jgi:hypothetical protein
LVTLDGTDVTPSGLDTDGVGHFKDKFVVPDVAMGDYTVTATDEEGFSDTHDFEVKELLIIVRCRSASPAFLGEAVSFYINSSEPMDDKSAGQYLEISLTDSQGYPYIVNTDIIPNSYFLTVEFPEDEGYHVVLDLVVPIPHDAPTGIWEWEAVAHYLDGTKKEKMEFEGTFEVADVPIAEVVAEVGELAATLDAIQVTLDTDLGAISGMITDFEDGVATIDTELGTIKGMITDIEDGVATIDTELGTVKADVSTVKGYFPMPIDLTPMWAAVALSLIAAIAAIIGVILMYRKVA